MGRDATKGEKIDFDCWGKSLMQIWLNGQLVDSVAADVSIGGWPSGEGVFETIRTQDGEIFELFHDAHPFTVLCVVVPVNDSSGNRVCVLPPLSM